MKDALVSIIIAVKSNNTFLKECVEHCLKLDYPNFEIIILPDEKIDDYADDRIRIISTGNVLPARKRDIGSDNASGEILAFLDDDTYPEKKWLSQAVSNFNDELITCVCGPAITPKNEPFLNLSSGKVYESMIVTGPARFRYLPLKKRFVDDFPSCNFLIRKEDFQKIGGFNTKFWPGEDTILCLEVVHNLNKKIIYDPLVKVYHHRRPLFKDHLKQVVNYAMHRGYFVKHFPKTSIKLGYFLPTLLVLVILSSVFSGLFINYKFYYISLLYLAAVSIFSIKPGLKLSLYVFLGSLFTHFAYGIFFAKGLFSNKLKEE